jgi:3-oxoacyl-[acyl-carrier-protein] synthase III
MSTGPPVTLDEVASHFPEREVGVEDLADYLRLAPTQVALLRRFHGLDRFRFDPEMDLFDLLLPPARAVLARLEEPDIRFLVYVHAIQDVTPSDLDAAQILAQRLGLPHAQAFAVTQQYCAQAASAIDLAGTLLAAEPDQRGSALVIVGEQSFTPMIQLCYPMGQLLADGAAACVVSLNGPGDLVRAHAMRSYGQYWDGLRLEVEHRQTLDDRVAALAAVVTRALGGAGVDLHDIDLIVPHNVNLTFWRQIARHFGIDLSRIYLDNVPRYSHCFAADPLINYAELISSGRAISGRHYLLASTGVGSTFTASVVTRR